MASHIKKGFIFIPYTKNEPPAHTKDILPLNTYAAQYGGEWGTFCRLDPTSLNGHVPVPYSEYLNA